MNKEDIQFLKELQHEMLTQDHVGQASPRFWVVMQTVRKYGIEDIYDYDGSVIIGDEGEECETDVDSMYNWLKNTLDINCELDFDRNNNAYIKVREYTDENGDVYEEERLNEAGEVTYYLRWTRGDNFSICNYKDVEEIVPDTTFLTIRECEEHIKSNHYHYNKPHTYAMTAWRSPQVERLYKILENTNWDEFIKGEKNNE